MSPRALPAPLEKQRSILDFTLSSLLRRKGKNLGLCAVYTLIVFVLASVLFFTQAIKREAAVLLRESPEILVQRVAMGRHDLIPAAYADAIRRIRGVASVRPRLWGYYFDPVVNANYTLVVPEERRFQPGTVAVGAGVARGRGTSPGDVISFRGHDGAPWPFEIVSVLPSESELVSSDLLLVSEEDFRGFFGVAEGAATDLAVAVRNPREVATIAAKIAEAHADTRPITREEILRTYDSVFDWRGGVMVVILSAAILAFLIFAWDKATGLSAEERREMGILKAVGWETSDVLALKFWEGAVVSLSSFFLGVLLAYVHVFLGSAFLFEPALKGWAVLYPEFRLAPYVSPYQLATLFFFTVVPYTAATIVPAWRSAVVDPDAVMRA